MNTRIYEFEAVIKKVPDIDGAYIEFPFDVREEFGNCLLYTSRCV